MQETSRIIQGKSFKNLPDNLFSIAWRVIRLPSSGLMPLDVFSVEFVFCNFFIEISLYISFNR